MKNITRAKVAFKFKKSFKVQKDSAQCFASASYSSILSLSAFILFQNPKLSPPYFQKISIQGPIDKQYGGVACSINQYFQPWCDYLFNLLVSSKAYQNNGEIYFISEVNQEYFQSIPKSNFNEIKSNHQLLKFQNQLKIAFNINYVQKKNKKKIGIFNYYTYQLQQNLDPFKPKVNICAIISGILFNNNLWKEYLILRKDIPTLEQLKQLDIVILSGSALGVNDNNQQVNKSAQILKQGLIANKKLKVVGICFGHQLIAKIFGGEVKQKGFIKKSQEIFFNKAVIQYNFMKDVQQFPEKSLKLSQIHTDYVVKDPQNFIKLAQSNSCENEAMISMDKRILTSQFHPQYTSQYVLARQLMADSYFKSQIEAETIAKCIHHHNSAQCWRITIRKFIEIDI